MTRKQPGQPITNYVSVESVDKYMAKVAKLGADSLHAEDRRAGDGLLCRLPGHREQHVRNLGNGEKGKIIVLKPPVCSS